MPVVVPGDGMALSATCEVVTFTTPEGLDSVVLTLKDGSTVTYTSGQLNQVLDTIHRVRGEIVSGTLNPDDFPGLTQVIAVSGSSSRTGVLPTGCDDDDVAPLPPEESETPAAPATSPPESEGPSSTPGQRPVPEPGEPAEPGEPTAPPRIVGGPPTDSGPDELPATGTDVPTRLLVSALALVLGFALLRMNPPVPASDPETINGFRRPPR